MSARRVPFPHRVCLGCAGAPVSWSAWATWGAMRDATPIVLGQSGCFGTQLPHTPPSFRKLARAHPPPPGDWGAQKDLVKEYKPNGGLPGPAITQRVYPEHVAESSFILQWLHDPCPKKA